MDIVIANGFAMERCAFFSREYHCCVLHNTRCKCEDYNPRNSKPITNYDLLRAKSVEEMAEKIGESIDCEVCKTMHHSESGECPCRPHQSCVDFWLDWLKQEAQHKQNAD